MDHTTRTDSEPGEFPFDPPSGAWYDRPADTALLEPAPPSEPTAVAPQPQPAVVSDAGTEHDAAALLDAAALQDAAAPQQTMTPQRPFPGVSSGSGADPCEVDQSPAEPGWEGAVPPTESQNAPSEWEELYDSGLDPTTHADPPAGAADAGAGHGHGVGSDGEALSARELEARLRPPMLPEGLGINQAVLEDIVLRQVVVDVRNTTTAIAEKLHLTANLVDVVVQTMRDRNLVEYQGMDGRSYVVGPTEAGRNHANHRSAECRYMGPVPVSLGLYREVVRSQHPQLALDRRILTEAFEDLVIAADLLDELGPAIHGDGAMFLYGPPGTGKSSVAERIVRAHHDYVLIPHCIEVEGQIVTVYDPTLHTALAEQPTGLDPRWIACERPAVITGGELHAGMLDLAYEPDSGVYLAPLQLKANNGIFVIDDFGRQSASPEELLNRWIVPLDRGIDYLTLMGRKFEVPFDLKVVLSTNMQPAKLGDDAFFRRIHSKVFVGACSDTDFDEILRRVTGAEGISVTEGTAEHLRYFARTQGDGELRAYLPGTVCKLAMSICSYMGTEPKLDPEMVDRVMSLYFTRDF